jgi:hypothetical protein
LYFQLVPLTHHTEETEFGLWLTPTSSDKPNDINSISQMSRDNLAEETQRRMLPTPKAGDWKDQGSLEMLKGLKEKSGQYALMRELASMMLPTPSAADGFKTTSNTHQENLNMLAPVGSGFQLNPPFVGEMMGFPPTWTELPFLNGEVNQSKPTETP